MFPGSPAVARQMFGYPAGFVNGNMFMGLHQDRMVLRLPPEPRQELLAMEGAATFEPMPGRRMSGWVAVSGNLLADESLLRRWATRAFRHVSAMPPKARKVAGRKR